MTDRNTFIKLIQTALNAGRADYARHVANDWLAQWPGDTTIGTYLARAEMEFGLLGTAVDRLLKITTTDPENIDAFSLLASGLRTQGQFKEANGYQASARLMNHEPLDPALAPRWALQLEKAMQLVRSEQFEAAAAKASVALTADPKLILPTYTLMSIKLAAGQEQAALTIAENGHERWPNCVGFLVLLGQHAMEEGESLAGVEFLHQAASNDPAREISRRYLREYHQYAELWPANLFAELSRPIPAVIATQLGDNQLSMPIDQPATFIQAERQAPPKKRSIKKQSEEKPHSDTRVQSKAQEEPVPSPEPWESFRGPNVSERSLKADNPVIPDALLDVDIEFRRLAQRLNARRRARDEDGRSPAYIVLSSRSRLLQHLDDDGFQAIDDQILTLIENIRRRFGWTAYRIYIDDPHTLEPFNLSPVDPGNAWQIKLRLADLDQVLSRRGEMIGAVLIVGGDGIIPFHLLPNPTDDDDEIIPSDNPYASSDENYFVPEWPVGRLPGEDEPELLLRQLKYAIGNHKIQAAPRRSIWDVFRWMRLGFARFLASKPKTMGYTASIWRKASFAVYKTIGDPNSMITSPPSEANQQAMRSARLSYFNLHGLEDTPEWYGQRDPIRDQNAQIEFPIALRPSDVINSGRAPHVVFTEACYGANSIGKTADTALSLKFLSSGSRAVVGSTKISYGSVTPPLIAADLLGQLFWHYLNQRLPVGEALRRAKLKLATEMHKRQGYLDGEDQKTLISFVLYGDPLYQPSPDSPRPGEKTVIRRVARPASIKTTASMASKPLGEQDLAPATMKRIEHIVGQYLPGMQQAVCKIHDQRIECYAGNDVLSSDPAVNAAQTSSNGPMVITLSKKIPDGKRQHPHFARLTLDPEGKVMKLAVSR